jgi:hypothetical protein
VSKLLPLIFLFIFSLGCSKDKIQTEAPEDYVLVEFAAGLEEYEEKIYPEVQGKKNATNN